jgi:hypothetical protein
MGITTWIIVLISAFITLGVIAGLVVYVVDMFSSHQRPKRRARKQKKKRA